MASTELKRKARKNRVVSKLRKDNIKRLTRKPVLKLVDIEKIKEEFAAKAAEKKKPAPEEKAKEHVNVPEVKAEKKKEAPKAEKPKETTVAVKKTKPKSTKKAPAKKKETKA